MKPDLRIPVEALHAGQVTLSEENGRYAVKVHRKRKGDRVVLFDPAQGTQARGLITHDLLPHVVVEVSEAPEKAPTHNLPLTLIQALGKGDKPEQAVRDATVFGAEEIYFVETARAQVRSGIGNKEDRLSKIAAQVARQCGRADLPSIYPECPLIDAIEKIRARWGNETIGLVCAFHESSVPLLQVAREGALRVRRIVLVVGPEGGFEDSELRQLLDAGFLAVSLGPYVLRTEVACGAALAILRASASVIRQG